MKRYQTILPVPAILDALPGDSAEKILFFDLETTGLSWRTSHLVLIGWICLESGRWKLTQIFLESPLEERQAICEFLSRILDDSLLIHYNGSTFDIPYLSGKCSLYQIHPVLEKARNLNLYQKLRPLRRLFGLSSMKQRDLEPLTGFFRQDHLTGKEVLSCYQKYILSGEESLCQDLFKHNREDLTGLTRLLSLLTLIRWFDSPHPISSAVKDEEKITFLIDTDFALLRPLSLTDGDIALQGEGHRLRLSVKILSETLKLFFEDHRNYYYLPQEDMAIHKSVGQFVDRSCRRQATPSTCYQKIDGRFLPAPPGFSALSLFCRSRKEKEKFCLLEELLSDPAATEKYVFLLLRFLIYSESEFSNKKGG